MCASLGPIEIIQTVSMVSHFWDSEMFSKHIREPNHTVEDQLLLSYAYSQHLFIIYA